MRRIFGCLLLSTAAAAPQFVISTYAGGVFLPPTPAVALNAAIGSPAAVRTPEQVLIAGGSLGDLGGSTIAGIYHPATGAFSATGKMTAGIDLWAAAALLPEGKVLITGESYRGCLSIPGGGNQCRGWES